MYTQYTPGSEVKESGSPSVSLFLRKLKQSESKSHFKNDKISYF